MARRSAPLNARSIATEPEADADADGLVAADVVDASPLAPAPPLEPDGRASRPGNTVGAPVSVAAVA